MTDFAQALEEGFSSARRASDARTEIDGVFNELDSQVLRKSEGKLSIKRGHRTSEEDFLRKIADFPALTPRPPQDYSAIIASNPKVKAGRQLVIAIWSQDKEGYPCRLTWGDQQHICEDKVALAEALADLLRDPEVASILLHLRGLEVEPNATR
ncbi:MAG: hypothetical protein AB1646_15925 [Thermodesulfobacteriota bacterium]